MRMFLLMAAPALLLAGPAPAQDYMGAASDSLSSASSYAGTVAVNSHLKRGSRSRNSGPALNRQSRQMCANKSAYRSRFGADDPRVTKLYSLCRQGGM